MFLFIRELPKSRKKSFFSSLICSPSSILKAIFVKFSISEDKIFGILDFSNKPFTSLILLSSLEDFEEYNFISLSFSTGLNNCLALMNSKVFLFSRISPPIFLPNFSSSPKVSK